MVTVSYDPGFKKKVKKLDGDRKERVKKQIRKIVENPEVGKPMRYSRKGTREVYVGSFRLSYAYLEDDEEIILLDVYHKDDQ